MINLQLNKKEYSGIFKIGNGEFELNESSSYDCDSLEIHIINQPEEEVIKFLEFQYSDNHFPFLFLFCVKEKIDQRIISNETSKFITEWILKKLDLDKYQFGKFFELFNTPRTDTSEYKKLPNLSEDINSYIQNKDTDFIKRYLQYGIDFYKEVQISHNNSCDKNTCAYDIAINDHIEIIENILIQIEPSKKIDKYNKMIWNGTQLELAELFIELKQKGWINTLEYKAIQKCFTDTASMSAYLSPYYDKDTKKPTYEKVFGAKNHIARFSKLPHNPNT